MIFDFHAHPSFKPFNSRSIYHPEDKPLPGVELWRERFRPKKNTHPLPFALEKEINYTSQIHLNSLAEGGVKGVCVSLYPLERVFTVALKDYKSSILFKILGIIPGLGKVVYELGKKPAKKGFFKMVGTLTGYDADVITEIHGGNYHYYKQMVKERNYLIKYQNKQPDHGIISYQIANNYTEYKSFIEQDQLAFIFSVEGMNGFLDKSTQFDEYVKNEHDTNTQKKIKKLFTDHLMEFKTHQHPPFVITLAHHQYNFLTGHAPSFVGIAQMAFDQEGKTKDQNGTEVSYFDLGFTKMGEDIRDLILNRSKGRRVLIDTKHLSAQARRAYHDFVIQKKNTDPIPIVQTHTAVNGRPVLGDAKGEKLELSKKEQKNSEFFTISINLFDDEMIEIIDSDGLIGLMLDEKRLMGKKLPKTTITLAKELEAEVAAYPQQVQYNNRPKTRFEYNKKLFKKNLSRLVKYRRLLEQEKMRSNPRPKKLKRFKANIDKYEGRVSYRKLKLMHCFFSIFMNQVLYIIKTVENADSKYNHLKGGKAWDHICIGSDYEGVINPLDIFYYARDLQGFESQLTIYWHKAIFLSKKHPEFKPYQDYLFGKQPGHYVKKILWGNSEEFLKKYFTDEYLKQGTVPTIV